MGLCSKFHTSSLYNVLLIFITILLLINADHVVSGSEVVPSAPQRSLQSDENNIDCQPQQNLEFYSIPPFAVQFTTLDVQDIPSFNMNIVISETDAKASSLTYPLKMATQEFLMSHFRSYITSMNNDSKTQQMYQAYYQQLTEVELRVVLKHNPQVTDIPGHVALIATMHGTLHFYHQMGCGGTTLQPSQSEVTITFGGWLETILETKRQEYLQSYLLSNNQEMLREIVELELIPNYYRDSQEEGESWLLVVWVVVGILGLGCLGVAGMVLMRGGGSRRKQPDPNFMTDHHNNDRQLDSKQHGMDISAHRRHSLDVLNKSDEYLSKYHPDLTDPEGNGSTTTRQRSGFGGFNNIMSLFDLSLSSNTPEKTTPTASRGRRSLATRARSSIELQAGNIAAANSEDPSPYFDDISLNHQHESEEAIMMAAAAQSSSSYRPISSMWRSMTSIFRGGSSSSYSYNNNHDNDGIMKNANFFFDGNEEEYFRQLEEERLKDEQWMTFMKEEEKDYNFAFKDFPRKDGTPCLIYNGGSYDADDMFTVRSPKAAATAAAVVASSSEDGSSSNGGGGGDDDEMTTPDMLNEREILSDEAFRQLLNMNTSPSFEDTTTLDKKSLPPAIGYKSPEFNERLSSLFAEKHRQYEKRSIVERHQQKRKKERELERRERQKDMHRELEALEAGMAMSDKWRVKHHVSPRPYDLSPGARSFSPKNIHMRRMSPARPSSASVVGRSPILSARRSPVPMTSSIPPRHSASKSFDLLDGLDDASSSSIQLIRPRMSRPHAAPSYNNHIIKTPPKEVFADSRYHLSADLDPSSLDKLSMPTMNKTANIPPFPLVSDDPPPPPPAAGSGKILPPRNPATVHRRVNSTDNLLYLTGNRSGNLETIGAMMTPPRRGMSPISTARRGASPRPTGSARGISPIRPISRGMSPARSSARGMSPARSSTGTRGMSPARSSTRGMSPARISAARRGTTSPSTRGRGPVRGLSPKPGARSASNSSLRSREGDIFDHGIAALF